VSVIVLLMTVCLLFTHYLNKKKLKAFVYKLYILGSYLTAALLSKTIVSVLSVNACIWLYRIR